MKTEMKPKMPRRYHSFGTAAVSAAILLCVAGSARPSVITAEHDTTLQASRTRAARQTRTVWAETSQMALFGAGLSYIGIRLGKRKA